jgi:hypothetical protein
MWRLVMGFSQHWAQQGLCTMTGGPMVVLTTNEPMAMLHAQKNVIHAGRGTGGAVRNQPSRQCNGALVRRALAEMAKYRC